ncbi:MAG: sulfite exporter TauE/SafE family protein [Acidimicrobiales bacterium]
MDSVVLISVATFGSLFLSSIAGYGGSLILVPVLVATLGPKEGIAFAALLLAWNNVFKVIAYRRTLSLRPGWALLAVTAVGSFAGASLLVSTPEQAVYWAIVLVTVGSLAAELRGGERLRAAQRWASAPLMSLSALLSGFSGTSGPLKGIAIRSLRLPRLDHVGLAAVVSLMGDGVKLQIFATAGLLSDIRWPVLAVALPLMPIAAWTGRAVNERVDERRFQWVFWTIVGGYTFRMMGVWF